MSYVSVVQSIDGFDLHDSIKVGDLAQLFGAEVIALRILAVATEIFQDDTVLDDEAKCGKERKRILLSTPADPMPKKRRIEVTPLATPEAIKPDVEEGYANEVSGSDSSSSSSESDTESKSATETGLEMKDPPALGSSGSTTGLISEESIPKVSVVENVEMKQIEVPEETSKASEEASMQPEPRSGDQTTHRGDPIKEAVEPMTVTNVDSENPESISGTHDAPPDTLLVRRTRKESNLKIEIPVKLPALPSDQTLEPANISVEPSQELVDGTSSDSSSGTKSESESENKGRMELEMEIPSPDVIAPENVQHGVSQSQELVSQAELDEFMIRQALSLRNAHDSDSEEDYLPEQRLRDPPVVQVVDVDVAESDETRALVASTTNAFPKVVPVKLATKEDSCSSSSDSDSGSDSDGDAETDAEENKTRVPVPSGFTTGPKKQLATTRPIRRRSDSSSSESDSDLSDSTSSTSDDGSSSDSSSDESSSSSDDDSESEKENGAAASIKIPSLNDIEVASSSILETPLTDDKLPFSFIHGSDDSDDEINKFAILTQQQKKPKPRKSSSVPNTPLVSAAKIKLPPSSITTKAGSTSSPSPVGKQAQEKNKRRKPRKLQKSANDESQSREDKAAPQEVSTDLIAKIVGDDSHWN